MKYFLKNSFVIQEKHKLKFYSLLDKGYPNLFRTLEQRENRDKYMKLNGNDAGSYLAKIDPSKYKIVEQLPNEEDNMWSNDGIGGQIQLFEKYELLIYFKININSNKLFNRPKNDKMKNILLGKYNKNKLTYEPPNVSNTDAINNNTKLIYKLYFYIKSINNL